MSKTTARQQYALPTLTILLITRASAYSEVPDQVLIECFHKPKCISCGQYINNEGYDQVTLNLKKEYGDEIYID
jgi:hypothetical protein